MSNLRIISDNAADRATLTASSEAGTRTAAKLQTAIKSDTWRATGTSATITATWATPQAVGGVVLPFCNITSQATIRARAYYYADDIEPLLDTGTIYAAPASPLGKFVFGVEPLAPNAYRRGGANTFAFGGGAYARAWFASRAAARKVVIDIDDHANPDGYLEAGRLVIGGYWEPEHNCDYGARVCLRDASKQERGGGGDLFVTPGSRWRRLSFDISYMPDIDKSQLWAILRDNGLGVPLFISIEPNAADPRQEQIGQIYGCLTRDSELAYQIFGHHQSTIEMDES